MCPGLGLNGSVCVCVCCLVSLQVTSRKILTTTDLKGAGGPAGQVGIAAGDVCLGGGAHAPTGAPDSNYNTRCAVVLPAHRTLSSAA
jgi:hypothetical protein